MQQSFTTKYESTDRAYSEDERTLKRSPFCCLFILDKQALKRNEQRGLTGRITTLVGAFGRFQCSHAPIMAARPLIRRIDGNLLESRSRKCFLDSILHRNWILCEKKHEFRSGVVDDLSAL
jgi:hypothetical protein